jgi:thiamine-phosphate pyrophosphorylase
MFKIICVTNRAQCENFRTRLYELYENGITVILREKDLTEDEYEKTARSLLEVCPTLTAHTYINAAKNLGIKKIHLPLRMMNKNVKNEFETVGVSVHSAKEAAKAEKMGASYVTAGHVFVTDCKKGLAPRGEEFLKDVVNAVNIPVYGIGGINPSNIEKIRKTGAAGACIMSGFMLTDDLKKYLEEIGQNLLKK